MVSRSEAAHHFYLYLPRSLIKKQNVLLKAKLSPGMDPFTIKLSTLTRKIYLAGDSCTPFAYNSQGYTELGFSLIKSS